MKFAKFVTAACFAAVPFMTPVALADGFSKTEDAVNYRQSSFKLLSHHVGALTPVVRGQAPFDAAQVKEDVALIKTLSGLPWKAFGEGRQGGKARDGVWSDNAKFKQLAANLQGEVDKLVVAADTGDLANVRTAFGAVGASCKACHDSFRNR